ncbi:MAG TPA: glycosyltransferase family 39 protein [Candidatus Limnocylindrales bacterium]|nr:glycosyltransferase family 39 protein [Candidatus Limnocylindrales bacterium]
MKSKRAIKSSKAAPSSNWPVLPWVAAFLCAVILASVWFFFSHGYTLYYGDAEAHLNIARRIVDSQTPGYDELGGVWLPLTHVLLIPFARVDSWWHSGIAGAMPSAICFVIAGCFLFAAVRRIFDSASAGFTAAALFALNPNILYLDSVPMMEPPFWACFLGLLYFSVRFRQTLGWGALAGAGVAACLGSLTRYEAWFILPFAAVYFLAIAKRRRVLVAVVFTVIAAIGPLYWFGHNWWLTGDPLDFYRGPYAPAAIQKGIAYPGLRDWGKSVLYYRTAAILCSGPGLALLGAAGVLVALARRAWWPVLLLLLPGVFYVWNMHSAAGPIYVPALTPFKLYNTRYGTAVIPLMALAAAALVTVPPRRMRPIFAVLITLAGSVWWAAHASPRQWVTWEESRVNSEGRRAWTRQAAEYLKPRFIPGSGLLTSFGDITAIYREAGIPLRYTFTGDNGLPFDLTVRRPDLLLWQEWVVAMGGDEAQSGVLRAGKYGIQYELVDRIVVNDAPVIEIYRRTGGKYGPS